MAIEITLFHLQFECGSAEEGQYATFKTKMLFFKLRNSLETSLVINVKFHSHDGWCKDKII